MSWRDEYDHPFAGIAEKLKRADENIVKLNHEIIGFFGASKYPIVPNPNTEGWQEAVNYHRNLPIPVRFSVLCGEVVHHLRSCLDHIVWHFSNAAYRLSHENAIQFPVLRTLPVKDELSRYERQVKGITNANVLRLIESFQPYHRGNDAMNDPLCIIHDMDRFDKHRELTLISPIANLMPLSSAGDIGIQSLIKFSQGETLSEFEIAVAQGAIQKDIKVTPQIAFAQFGNRESEPVIPALVQLSDAVDRAADRFASEV